MPIALIATVLNEGESIRPLMESIMAQTCPPDEVVIVDGGSRDDTVATLHEYADILPLRVLVAPGANISTGRNRAIEAAQSSLIAVTDAGVVLEPNWLERLARPLLDDANVDVAAGFFVAEPRTIFEAALGATTLPLASEIDSDTFLPSSRSVAFRKTVWEKVGGYPEWLDYCEDLIFDLRLRQIGARQVFVPEAIARFRPRLSLRAFYRQYYRYARGDGKADLWRKRHAARYLTYLVALPPLLIGLLGGRGVLRLVPLLFLGLGGAVYLRQPYRRLPSVLQQAQARDGVAASPADSLYAAALIPIIRVVGDVAKMLGYPVGWAWRMRNHPPKWTL